jgi:exonuclease VII small subunit
MTDQRRVGPSDAAELSYEPARAERAAVERREAGGCTLEETLAPLERGEAYRRRLDGARACLDADAEHTW